MNQLKQICLQRTSEKSSEKIGLVELYTEIPNTGSQFPCMLFISILKMKSEVNNYLKNYTRGWWAIDEKVSLGRSRLHEVNEFKIWIFYTDMQMKYIKGKKTNVFCKS